MKKWQVPLVSIVAVILALASGCAVNHSGPVIPNAATPAQQAERKAADACGAVASGLKLAQDSLSALHQAGGVSQTEYTAIHAILVQIAVKNDAAIAAVKAAEASGASSGWQGAAQAVTAVASTLTPATLNISNPQSKATFTSALSVLEASVALLSQVA